MSAAYWDNLRKMLEQSEAEIFLMEATPNEYTPRPPEGFFAMRSHKSRVFIPLDNGCIPDSEIVLRHLRKAKSIPLS